MLKRIIVSAMVLVILLTACLFAAKVFRTGPEIPRDTFDLTMHPDNVSDPGNSAISDPTQVFIYDLTNGKMLYEHGTDRRIIPASVTKLLTALTALDMMPESAVIAPGDELQLVAKDASIAYIMPHHRLTLSMLIEGMLLPSGNDAAYAVAAGAARYETADPGMSGAEAVGYFMQKVNEYAAELGCTGTHFTVPDGYAYDDHYTTAHDLVIIAEKALESPVISRYASLLTAKVTYASGHTNTWNNTNLLINPESPYYRKSVTGLKTGSLTDSYSLLVSAEINRKTYVIGIFSAYSSDERYRIADSIIDRLSLPDE